MQAMRPQFDQLNWNSRPNSDTHPSALFDRDRHKEPFAWGVERLAREGAVCSARCQGQFPAGCFLSVPNTAFQFFLPPSCNACNAFSTPSEPETWLGGNSLNVERNWPMIIVAGIMTHNFLPHHSP